MSRFLPRSVLVFLAMCVVSATSAHALGSAAPFDLRTYRPAFSEFSLGSIDLPRVGPGLGQGNAFAYADYTYRPLVYTQGNQPLFDLLTHRITLDTGFSLTVWRNRLQLGLALPVTVYQVGQLPPSDATTRPLLDLPLPSASLEDLHLLAKGVFYHSGGSSQYTPQGGIGLLLDLTLPTGNADAFSGSRYPTLTAALLASFAYQRVTAAVQFGGLFSSSEALYAQPAAGGPSVPSNQQGGIGLVYKLGVLVRVWEREQHSLSVGAEAYGRALPPFEDKRRLPTELLGSFVWNHPYGQVTVGVGAGLTPGVGTPDARVVLGVRVPWPGKLAKTKPLPPPPELPPKVQQVVPPPKPAVPVFPPLPQGLRCAGDPLQPIPETGTLLDDLAALLRLHPEWPPLEVIAHTHNLFSEYDAWLTTRRCAQAVAHALQQRGVSPERLHPRPDAFYCPVTDTQHTEPLQMQNHRVSLHWVHPNQPLDEVSTCTIP